MVHRARRIPAGGLIDDLFAPWCDRVLENGAPTEGHQCVAHADPSVSQAGFGFAVAHRERLDDTEHYLMDLLHAWNPREFPDGKIDYDVIEDEIFRIGMIYNLAELTFDQYESAGMHQRLQRRFKEAGLRTRVHVLRETGRENWTNAERFKTALGQRLVHAPRHALAEGELRALQLVGPLKVGPSRKGIITTCDIVDCMIAVVAMLTSAKNKSDIDELFSNARPSSARLHRIPAQRFSGPKLPYRPGKRSPW